MQQPTRYSLSDSEGDDGEAAATVDPAQDEPTDVVASTDFDPGENDAAQPPGPVLSIAAGNPGPRSGGSPAPDVPFAHNTTEPPLEGQGHQTTRLGGASAGASPVHGVAVSVSEPDVKAAAAPPTTQSGRKSVAVGEVARAPTSPRDTPRAGLPQKTTRHEAVSDEEQVAALRAEYEGRLSAQAQQLEVAALKIERLELQLAARTAAAATPAHQGRPGLGRRSSEAGAAEAAAAGGAGAAPILVPAEEVLALQKEVAAQERLLAAYQQENQAASKRIKELERSVKELSSVRAQHPLPMTHHHHEPPPGIKASSRDVAERLAEVLALQRDLEAVKETSEVREAELRAQIERLRAEKRDLEARAAGVDLKANQEGDALVAAVRAEMEAMRGQYTAAIGELRSKVSWYAENQALLSGQDALVAQQKEAIAALEARLAAHEGPEGRSAAARIARLQAQVSELQAALKSKGLPRSLAAVIEAAKPPPGDGAALAEAQRKMADLEARLAAKDEEYERQLRSYQQQYEALRAAFEERGLQGGSDVAAKGAGPGGRSKREAALAAQVEELRAMYTRQIKELKAKLQQAQGLAARPSGGAGVPSRDTSHSGAGEPAGPPAALLQAREAEVARLQHDLAAKSKQVAELHLQLGEMEARLVKGGHSQDQGHGFGFGGGGSGPGAPGTLGLLHPLPVSAPLSPSLLSPAKATTPYAAGRGGAGGQQDGGALAWHSAGGLPDGMAVPLLQQQQVALLAAQLDVMRQQLAQAQAQAVAASAPRVSAEPGTVAAAAAAEAVRRAEAAELALASVQRTHTEAIERCAALREEHQRAVVALRDEVAHTEALKWRDRVAAAETEAATARSRIAGLEAALADARASAAVAAPRAAAPGAAEFAAHEARLDAMSRDAAAREAKWRGVLEDTQALHSVQMEVAAHKLEAGLAAKNAELRMLKARVDELLASAARLQGLRGSRGGDGGGLGGRRQHGPRALPPAAAPASPAGS